LKGLQNFIQNMLYGKYFTKYKTWVGNIFISVIDKHQSQ